MTIRTFEVWFSIYHEDIGAATIELDQRAIDTVDDLWRSQLYNLRTPEDIAAHIAYNMVINKLRLSQMDGWADMPDSYARIISWPDLDQWEIEAKEVK
jgi:hypothetical protein